MEKESNSLKYEILQEQYLEIGEMPKLFRIRALKDLPNKGVKKGDFGGWIESEENLSQKGDCWIGELAMVYGNSYVKDFALVTGKANVSDRSTVQDHAKICDDAVLENTCVKDCARVSQHAKVRNSVLLDYASVEGNAVVTSAELSKDVYVLENAIVSESKLTEHVSIGGCVAIDGCFAEGECEFKDNAIARASTFKDRVKIGGSSSIVSSDLDGVITVNGDAEINRCSVIKGKNIVINSSANLYEDNYIIMGPIAGITCMIFYHSGEKVLCSVNNMVYDAPIGVLIDCCDDTHVQFKYLKKLIHTAFKMLKR